MKLKVVLIPVLALALMSALAISHTAAQTFPPSSPAVGTRIANDLLSPRGMKVGPDGMVYIAEAGSGGSTKVTTPNGDLMTGLTGRISKIDPTAGTRTTLAANLPSIDTGMGAVIGPADVAFIGSQLYYVQSEATAADGFGSHPTGIYKVNADGSTTLYTDLATFNDANPSTSVKTKAASDVDPGGNPYSMIVRNGDFYIVDGNQNSVVKVTGDGKTISRFVDFPTDITTTGIGFTGSGAFYISTLGPFPWDPADGRIYTAGFPSGTLTQIASGFSSLTDVEVGPNGVVYAAQFGDQSGNPQGIPWKFNSGKLLRLNSSNKLEAVVSGFNFSTAIAFSGDTAFITSNGISMGATGEVWKIDNVSALTPLALPTPAPTAATAPAPTVAPAGGTTGVITAPNTGSGGEAAAGGGSYTMLLVLGVVSGTAVMAAAGVLWRRRA